MKRFTLTPLLIAFASVATAQTAKPPAVTPLTSLKSSWQNIRDLGIRSAELMPEEHYGFRPVTDVRTFGEIIGHLANEHYLICAPGKGEPNPNSVDFEKTTKKAELVKALRESAAYCDSLYTMTEQAANEMPASGGRRSRFGAALLNVTHDSEHYGNLVTYLRMKGLVPPSSQPTTR
ncbi:MAG: DinB family protein [Acidobacteria bacterium]|nr:DinB family protein [Acidobacteriota bacterium]